MAKTGQLIEARTEITFIPIDDKKKVHQPVILKDNDKRPRWNGGKDIDIRVIHNPSNGSINSARTNIVFDQSSVKWLWGNGLIEETLSPSEGKRGFLIRDNNIINIKLSKHSRYSNIVISRQSKPIELCQITPIAEVVAKLIPYNPHGTPRRVR